MNAKIAVLKSVIRPITDDERTRYTQVTHRLDVVIRLNGTRDFEYAQMFRQGDEARAIALTVSAIVNAVLNHEVTK